MDITCTSLINAAGHGAHDAATGVDGVSPARLPPRFLAKGNYCSVSGKSPFTHLVYPVPVAGALGIHATLDMGGAVRFGPDIQWITGFDYGLPDGLPEKFSAAVESYWPGVRDRTLSPSYCGIRPKVHGPEKSAADFIIQGEAEHGIAGLCQPVRHGVTWPHCITRRGQARAHAAARLTGPSRIPRHKGSRPGIGKAAGCIKRNAICKLRRQHANKTVSRTMGCRPHGLGQPQFPSPSRPCLQ